MIHYKMKNYVFHKILQQVDVTYSFWKIAMPIAVTEFVATL